MQRDIDAIYICGPGHGGPAIVANAFLEGTYTEVYPDITFDDDGPPPAFPAFSAFLVGSPATPRPRRLGRFTKAASWAMPWCMHSARRSTHPMPWLFVSSAMARRRPGPSAASWHSNKFLDPVHDGAVLPILHLNGYKIANPTVLARIPAAELLDLFSRVRVRGPTSVAAASTRRRAVHQFKCASRSRLTARSMRSPPSRQAARERREIDRPRWPMIVLRTPKGWTGPREVDGVPVEGTLACAPGPAGRSAREQGASRAALETWLKSYRPEELFDATAASLPT